MDDHFQELNLLILDITNSGKTPTEKEQKRKIAIEKARSWEISFTRTFILLPDEQAVASFIFIFVKTVHIWLEKLYLTRPEKAKANQQHQELEIACTAIIHFVQKHFPGKFNYQEYMPHCLWDPIKQQLAIQWRVLEEADKSKADLIQLLYSIYQQQLKHTETLNYHYAAYWVDLLSTLCSKETMIIGESDCEMISTLIKYNFNHESFICFFIEEALKEMEGAIPEKAYWKKMLQFVERIPLLNQLGLDPYSLNCKEQLREDIEKIGMISNEEKSATVTQTSSLSESTFHTTLSVSQLAVLFRLLVDTDILISTNHKELMRIVSQSFKTNRTTAAISEKHLYDKFYSLEPHALNILRTRLMEMIRKIKEMEGVNVRS